MAGAEVIAGSAEGGTGVERKDSTERVEGGTLGGGGGTEREGRPLGGGGSGTLRDAGTDTVRGAGGNVREAGTGTVREGGTGKRSSRNIVLVRSPSAFCLGKRSAKGVFGRLERSARCMSRAAS
jgi:hypothetical protein